MPVTSLACPSCGAATPADVSSSRPLSCPSCGAALVLAVTPSDGDTRCSACRTINDADLRTCAHCGEKLKAACPFCYTRNDAGDQHCTRCGASPWRAQPIRQPWLADKHAHDQERQGAWKRANERARYSRHLRLICGLEGQERYGVSAETHQLGPEAVGALSQAGQTDRAKAGGAIQKARGPLSFDQPVPDRNSRLVGVTRIFTDIVSPPVMFAALGAAVGWAGSSETINVVAAIVYGLLICAVPLALVVGLYKAGRISDLHMSGPGERRIPYLIGFLSSALAWAILSLLGASMQLRGLAICSTAGLGVLGFVDRYWLISNHSASITLVVLFSGLVFGELVGLVLSPLVALVFAARLYLGRHSFLQLLAGAVVGAAPVLLLGRLGFLT